MVFVTRVQRLLSVLVACALIGVTGFGDATSALAAGRRQSVQSSLLGITGVQVSPDASGLVLEANRAFTGVETRNFTVLKLPSPYRIVLDIPNARLVGGQNVFRVNQNGIDRVELTDTHSPFYSSVRATIFVDDNQTLARLTPEFEGKTLRVLGLAPASLSPAQLAATSFVTKPEVRIHKATQQTAQPLPPVAKPGAKLSSQPPVLATLPPKPETQTPAVQTTILDTPVPAGTAIIESVQVRDGKLLIQSVPGSVLRVKKRFTLSDPSRLVLDLEGAVLRSRQLLEPITTRLPEMRQVRVGQFDERTVRVVIECTEPDQVEAIYNGGEKNLLALTPDSGTSITKLSANTQLGEVQSIDLRREGGNTILRLSASTPIVHRFLKKDDRLVLDLLNQAAHPTNINFDARQYPEIEKMRLEPLTEGEPNSKLAIQLVQADTKITPSISDDGKVLELQISAERVAKNGGAFPNLAGLGVAGKAPFPARIVVDAGHGGKDFGAMRGGVNEKDLNLSLALMVRDALEAKGFKVFMTRSSDEFLPLPQITAITNQIRPDLFISIHHNASVNAAANGIETYYYTPQSVALARSVHNREINLVSARDGGVKKAMFYVIHHTNVPAILCEVGYVSNPGELTALQTYERKSKTARSIADGVVDYLKTRVSANAAK